MGCYGNQGTQAKVRGFCSVSEWGARPEDTLGGHWGAVSGEGTVSALSATQKTGSHLFQSVGGSGWSFTTFAKVCPVTLCCPPTLALGSDMWAVASGALASGTGRGLESSGTIWTCCLSPLPTHLEHVWANLPDGVTHRAQVHLTPAKGQLVPAVE